MGEALKKSGLTEMDYLVREERAERKSEYVDGELYAMAGASARHNKISGNLYVKLHTATRGTPCEVFMADMKVKVEAHRAFYYPDVMLACPQAEEHPLYRSAPCLIAEVLSPATANIDEREKWFHYRDIPPQVLPAHRLGKTLCPSTHPGGRRLAGTDPGRGGHRRPGVRGGENDDLPG